MVIIKKYYFVFLILIFSTFILSININKPFVGHHDWNGVWYSNFARNLNTYGWIDAKFASITNTELVLPKDFNYFTHYPPLLPILLSISFRIFGEHEWSARLVPLIFSLWTILMIFLLAEKYFGKRVATLAASISAVLPIFIYFGKMPVQEVLAIAPVLLSIQLYFDYFNNTTNKNLVKLISALVLSHLINWPGYYVTPLFFIHFMLFKKTKNKLKKAFIFPSISLAMFIIHSTHVMLLTGTPLGGGMTNVLLFRLNITEKPQDYTTFNFIKQQRHLLLAYFSKPVILLSAITTIATLFKIKEIKKSRQVQLLAILAIFGVTHNLVFRNMAFIHDYMIIYMWPFITISASIGAFKVLDWLKIRSSSFVIISSVILLAVIVLQTYKFDLALTESNGFYDGYQLGKIINTQTIHGQKTLILSINLQQNQDVFIGYYSNRHIDYEIPSQSDLEKLIGQNKYTLIIADTTKDTPQNLIGVLQKDYKTNTIGKFLLFKASEKLS